MTFLEMCKTARLISGIQGQGPTSVVGASGIEAVIVQFVKEAYVDIQNTRNNFDFLQKSKTFSTTIGKDNYTLSDIFVSNPDLKSFKKDSFLITDENGNKKYLYERDKEDLEYKYLNSTTRDLPNELAIEADKSLTLKPISDGVYAVSFKYYRKPQILATDAEVPLMPEEFHQLIVFKAVEKISIYLSQPEIYRGYATEASKLMGQMMREQVQPMRVKRAPFGGYKGWRR